MTNFFNRFANDESGVTAMEYGMIAALIAVGIITVVTSVGDQLETTFQTISDTLENANADAAAPAPATP